MNAPIWTPEWPTAMGYYLFFGNQCGHEPYPMVVHVCRSANSVLCYVTNGKLLDPEADRGMFRPLQNARPDIVRAHPGHIHDERATA